MAGLNFVDIARRASKQGIKPGRASLDWYMKQATSVRSIDVNRLMLDPATVDRVEPGKLYSYFYDPKWKDKLPYYDTFPLVFPFKVEGDKFWGINLHYLQPEMRAVLMDELYSLVDGRVKDGTKRLRLSYEVLNGAARFKAFRPCVKSYLIGHVKSRFLMIPYDQWATAIFLPTARFQKATRTKVWSDSNKKAGY